MLTAEQIEALGEQARAITEPITEFLLEDIARRVSEAGQLTSTASYQVWRLQNLGVSQKELKKELARRLKVSRKRVEELMTQAAEVGYRFDLSRLPHKNAVPFGENEKIQRIVSAGVEMAGENLTNMVSTLGFVTPEGTAEDLTTAYQKTCDFAFQKTVTGAQDYNSAIRQATKHLADRGIVTIDYESGRSISLEAAVRRNVMGGLGLMQERISQQNHDDLGCDGWEISAHGASAPDHEPIQGKQYSDAAFTRLNNSLLRRIGTLNCGHAAFPIILGVNDPQYSASELEQFRQENEKGIDYEGQHFTMYEATQRQRELERAVRKRKRKILIGKAAGLEEQVAVDQTRLVVLNGEYARFSKAAGLKTQRERAFIATGIPSPEATSEIAAIFTPNTKYRTEEGTFDLEQAKKDYETFLTTVPEKHKIYLQQSFETVLYQRKTLEECPYAFGYSALSDAIFFNPDHPDFDYLDFIQANTHELAHRMDAVFVGVSGNERFLQAILNGKATIETNPELFIQYCRQNDRDGYLSDILCGITDSAYEFIGGHPKSYWQIPGKREKEVFANILSLELFGDQEKIAFLKEHFPQMMGVYNDLEFEVS